MREREEDPNTVWIVRDREGRIVGASAIDAYSAADEPSGKDSLALFAAIDNEAGPTYTANGYTLTREALAAACSQGLPVSEAPATRVRVLDEWWVVDYDGVPLAIRHDEQQAKDYAASQDERCRVVRVAYVDDGTTEDTR